MFSALLKVPSTFMQFQRSYDFRERSAAILDHIVRAALSPPLTSGEPGLTTQDHAQVRGSNAAPGNTKDMEAASANLFRKECQVAARPEGQAALPHVFTL